MNTLSAGSRVSLHWVWRQLRVGVPLCAAVALFISTMTGDASARR